MELRNRLMTVVDRINDRKKSLRKPRKIVQQYKTLTKKKWS